MANIATIRGTYHAFSVRTVDNGQVLTIVATPRNQPTIGQAEMIWEEIPRKVWHRSRAELLRGAKSFALELARADQAEIQAEWIAEAYEKSLLVGI